MSQQQDEHRSWAKRLLHYRWDVLAGILAAVAAIVLVSLGYLDRDTLLAILTVLVATLFIRQLRRERLAKGAEASINDIHTIVSSMSSELKTVEAELLDLRSSRSGARLRIYRSRPEVYDSIANILEAAMDKPGEKVLDLVAFHGHSGERVTNESVVKDEFGRFNAVMRNCILGSSWRVRHIYNITTEERLKSIEERLTFTKSADGFEVKAFFRPDALQHLTPMVAVSDEIFLAIDDPKYYRMHKAFHIKSREAAEVVTEYFNSLWNRHDAFVLRSADRLRRDEIDRLRKRIVAQSNSRMPNIRI